MTTPQTEPKIAFKRAEPLLFVTDLERSLSYYTHRLGFDIVFRYGDPPFYAQVARGEAHLNLRLVVTSPFDHSALNEDYLGAIICIDSIQDLFAEFQTRDVEFHQIVCTEPWGARTFIVRDPDENLILFAE